MISSTAYSSDGSLQHRGDLIFPRCVEKTVSMNPDHFGVESKISSVVKYRPAYNKLETNRARCRGLGALGQSSMLARGVRSCFAVGGALASRCASEMVLPLPIQIKRLLSAVLSRQNRSTNHDLEALNIPLNCSLEFSTGSLVFCLFGAQAASIFDTNLRAFAYIQRLCKSGCFTLSQERQFMTALYKNTLFLFFVLGLSALFFFISSGNQPLFFSLLLPMALFFAFSIIISPFVDRSRYDSKNEPKPTYLESWLISSSGLGALFLVFGVLTALFGHSGSRVNWVVLALLSGLYICIQVAYLALEEEGESDSINLRTVLDYGGLILATCISIYAFIALLQ